MKKIKQLFALMILSIAQFCCSTHSSPDIIEEGIFKDTIQINIRGDLTHAVKYGNKYYCFFERGNAGYSSLSRKDFYILSEDGTIEKKVDIPKEMNTTYYDLFVKGDSIITKTYMDNHCYYLNLNNHKWEQVAEIDDVVYQDDDYRVTYLNFGEWGSSVWFKNVMTEDEYCVSGTPFITKFNEKYYITASYSILEIETPLKLTLCDTDQSYETVRQSRRHYENYDTSGIKVIFEDSIENDFSPNSIFHISTSYVDKDQLRHLYIGKDSVTYIGIIDNGELKPIDTLGCNIFPYRWHFSYRYQAQSDSSRFLLFRTDKDNILGFIEINGSHVKVRYVNNTYSEKEYGSYVADSLSKEIFNIAISDLGKLTLKQVDAIEQAMEATDYTQKHKISLWDYHYPNLNKYEFETPKIYQKLEDSLFRVHTLYFYESKSELVKVINFTWYETNSSYWGMPKEEKSNRIKLFQEKYDMIYKFIFDRYGLPKTLSYQILSWETPEGITIKLSGDDFNKRRRISLYLYKD